MPRKKNDLAEVVNSLMTLGEASQWIEQHREELGLAKPIPVDTLKKASGQGRLKAILKGQVFLTREAELREYLKKFDPKNKTERMPLKERAARKKSKEAEGETPAEPGQSE
jgi:hypothetical protein